MGDEHAALAGFDELAGGEGEPAVGGGHARATDLGTDRWPVAARVRLDRGDRPPGVLRCLPRERRAGVGVAYAPIVVDRAGLTGEPAPGGVGETERGVRVEHDDAGIEPVEDGRQVTPRLREVIDVALSVADVLRQHEQSGHLVLVPVRHERRLHFPARTARVTHRFLERDRLAEQRAFDRQTRFLERRLADDHRVDASPPQRIRVEPEPGPEGLVVQPVAHVPIDVGDADRQGVDERAQLLLALACRAQRTALGGDIAADATVADEAPPAIAQGAGADAQHAPLATDLTHQLDIVERAVRLHRPQQCARGGRGVARFLPELARRAPEQRLGGEPEVLLHAARHVAEPQRRVGLPEPLGGDRREIAKTRLRRRPLAPAGDTDRAGGSAEQRRQSSGQDGHAHSPGNRRRWR